MSSIETIDLTHVYMAGTARAVVAVDRVSLKVEAGEAVGIVGPTGSGKSTLVQHFNGLLRPSAGRVLVDGRDLWNPAGPAGPGERSRRDPGGRNRAESRGHVARADLRAVRRKVGLIFQFPEQQLFDETVFDDVAFGPRNLGLDEGEVRERVAEALAAVGLGGPEGEALARRSPFGLSGGQMRRVAVAGVLAMRPETLVLDEPTAGLDPRGRQGLLDTLLRLRRERGLTLVVVSHNMEDLASLVSRVVVLDRGRVVADGPVREVFSHPDRLRDLGLDAPPVVRLMRALADRGAPVRTDLLYPAEAAEEIGRWLRAGSPGKARSGSGPAPAEAARPAGGTEGNGRV